MARRNRPATTAHRPHCIPVALPRLESDPPLVRRRARDPRESPSRAWAASFACLRALFLLLASPNTFGPAHPPLHRALVFPLTSSRPPPMHNRTHSSHFRESRRTRGLPTPLPRLFYYARIRAFNDNAAPALRVTYIRRSMMKGSIESRTRGREIANAAFRKRETKGGEKESVECGVFCI